MSRASLALLALCASARASLPSPAAKLQTDYLPSDQAILVDGTFPPRFSWLVSSADRGVTQASYRIVVTRETAPATQVWDSGVVTSSTTAQVSYGGAALESDSVYSWVVTWTDSAGQTAPPSSPARFGTGLLTQAEWAPSAWIGCAEGQGINFNQLRAEFDLALPNGVTVTQARAYITAVGYYDLRVNGGRAQQWPAMGHPVLDPGWTTYEMTSLYNAYDITSQLVPSGPNALAVFLGNGWPSINPVPGNNSYARVERSAAELVEARLSGPKPRKAGESNGELRQARIQVRVRSSDGKTAVWASTAAGFRRVQPRAVRGAGAAPLGAWMCGTGALLYDDVYNGCTYNAQLETTGWDAPNYPYPALGSWTQAVLKADPGGAHPTVMRPQAFPAVTVQAELVPTSIASPAPGVFVFDCSQNIAGHVRLTLPAPVPAGLNVKMRHAELLMHPPYGDKDGNIYVGNLRSALATDLYTTKGASEDAEVFEPMFTQVRETKPTRLTTFPTSYR